MTAAMVCALAAGIGLNSCGSGTIGYLYALSELTSNGTYGQINGYKVDDQSGNLTNMVNSPYASGGINPANAVFTLAGRFLFVLNKNTGGTTGSVAEFLVGGDGTLTYQSSYSSQGLTPVWIGLDASNQFLLVLDQQNPLGTTSGGKVLGDVTVFSINSTTGRLTLVLNQQQQNTNLTQYTYFLVGPTPVMMKTVGSYLYTLDGDNSVNILSESGGQLLATANSNTAVSAAGTKLVNLSSDPAGRYIFLIDSGNNQILQYSIGTGGALAPISTGNTTLPALTSNPVWSLVSSNSKFLYVVSKGNGSNPNAAESQITAYTISGSTGQLQLIPDSPYPAGSGANCMVEDPSNQYVYVSNFNDSTVTGYYINANTGQLSSLSRSTVYPISGQPSCLVVSGFLS
jgi:6-phosphogluconolactonase (cycloisomerase 2 family)